MDHKITKAFGQAVALGAIAGMRTFSAPVVLSHVYRNHTSKNLKNTPLAFMQNMVTSKVFKVLGGGELIGDKLPFTPKRTAAGGLVGRFVSGALCGAVVFKVNNKQPVLGGLIGGAVAIGSAFGCMFLRVKLGKKSKLPDVALGLLEDAIVISAGRAIAKTL